MGLWIDFKAINKNDNKLRRKIELYGNWFLIDWCKNNMGLSQNDYDEGMFLSDMEKSDLIKLKEDCLDYIAKADVYPEYFNSSDDVKDEFRKLAEIVYATWVLLSKKKKKYTVEIYLCW